MFLRKLDEIAKLVKFEYTIQEVEDKKFGNMDENGDWNGIVRKVCELRDQQSLYSLYSTVIVMKVL